MTQDFNDADGILREFRKLNNLTVRVGALKATDGHSEQHMEMIAMANENGVPHIRPVHGQWLTIPTKLAGDHSAREIDGLFKPHGKNVLVKANGNGGLDIYFILKKEITVPKRPFLSGTFIRKFETSWFELAKVEISKLSVGEMTAREVMASMGRRMARDVQATISAMKSPANAPATIERKGKDNPLIDTGALYRSISWTEDVYG
ncbi:hypothetical protein [Levilactobacillus andaensis]|uniref:hypothetical protein n=1 Tax=Levilactobacillus andaensis TaxID=2799570 RepID=UPI00194310A6|nr:hypothetical protein [Levilactobacillus andaensis]